MLTAAALLSRFEHDEAALLALLHWLVNDAVRLKAYLAHVLRETEGVLERYAMPAGLLEPFPAQLLTVSTWLR